MRESNKISANCTQFNDVSSIEDAALQIVFVETFICQWGHAMLHFHYLCVIILKLGLVVIYYYS